MAAKEIETLSSRIAYKNRWMQVREDEIKRLDGSLGIYGVVEKPDYALIVPIIGESVVMVEQYRYPIGERVIEFPQGSREDEDVGSLELAISELREETGYCAKKIEHIGFIYQAYGYSNQKCDVFMASELIEGIQELENEEQGLIVKKFRIEEVEEMIKDGLIRDNASISSFCLLRMKGKI